MYQKILVPVDGSAPSNSALEAAIELGRLTQAQLRLFHVVDETSFALAAGYGFGGTLYSPEYTGDMIDRLKEAGKEILQAAEARVRAAGLEVSSVLHDSFQGRLCDQVLEQVAAWPADLIVLGSHGRRGLDRVFMGSDAESILRVAPVPVLLLRAGAAGKKA
jgi:nucleotide-binding universal stress UspA family protein